MIIDEQFYYSIHISYFRRLINITSDKIQITEGALYPTLHALEKQGDVITEKVYIGKRVRKYYILTNQGKKTVSERVNELDDFMNTMRFLLDLAPPFQHV